MASVSITKIGGGNLFDVKRFKAGVKTALDVVDKAVKADYNKTTQSWKHKASAKSIKESEDSRFIYVDDDVHQMLDVGTRPHIIRPKKKKRLAFRGGFRAKTTPGVIGSRTGGSYGAYVYANQVRHPGTKARKFTEAIAKRRENDLQNAIDVQLSVL